MTLTADVGTAREAAPSTSDAGARGRVVEPAVVVGVVGISVLAVATAEAPASSAAFPILLLPAALVDLRTHRLPDRLLAGALLVGLVGLVAGAVVDVGSDRPTPAEILVGVAVLALPLLVLHLADPDSMGFGDVKLAVVLGVAVGPLGAATGLVALVAATALALVAAVATRRRAVAFGPALVAGTAIALLLAPAVVTS